MPPTRLWNPKSNCKFVRLYRQQTCLWDTEDPAYRNKFCRQEAINKIVAAMDIPDLTPSEAKRRIKNLRSTFLLEVKRVVESMQSNDEETVYQPKLSWFNEMNAFIRCYTEENKIIRDKIQTPTKIGTETETDDDDDKKAIYIVAEDESDTPEASGPCSVTPRKKVRRVEDDKTITLPRLNTTNERNEFDIFGLHVSSQLRLLSTKEAIIAQEQIQSILTQGRLRDLEAEVGEYSGRTRIHLKSEALDVSEESFEDD